jgi:hypothetical protein
LALAASEKSASELTKARAKNLAFMVSPEVENIASVFADLKHLGRTKARLKVGAFLVPSLAPEALSPSACSLIRLLASMEFVKHVLCRASPTERMPILNHISQQNLPLSGCSSSNNTRKTHMRKLLLTALISIASLSVMGQALAKGTVAGGSQGGRESAANSNGLKSTDRDFGKDRAADRAQIKDKKKTFLNANGVKSVSKAKGKARAGARHHRVSHPSPRK